MDTDILKVIELRTYFFTRRGVIKAVDGVSFSLKEGEALGIVGESGCGKSVTALSILRIVPNPPGKIIGGKIIFEGEDLLQKCEKEMAKLRGQKISMVLQDPATSLDPVFTAGSQLTETIRLDQRVKKDGVVYKAIEMLRMFGIPSPEMRLNDYPHQLSGGIKQRVVGSIALCRQPRLLIADEPTTNLDVTIQAQVLRLLKRMQSELKLSILFITHDLGIVARLCERVAVMYAGKIVESADVRRLFYNPVHPYTVGLLDSLPKLGTKSLRLPSIPGQIPDPLKLPQGCPFAPRCSKAVNKCTKGYPPQVRIADGHHVSCWLSGQ